MEEDKRGKILKTAQETINGERQDSYGNPEDSFKTIAAYWTAYLKAEGLLPDDKELSPLNSTVMMTLFKIARMSGQEPHIDNFVDAAGYLGIAGDILEKNLLPNIDKLVNALELEVSVNHKEDESIDESDDARPLSPGVVKRLKEINRHLGEELCDYEAVTKRHQLFKCLSTEK